MTATHSIAPTLLVAIDISTHRRRRLTITNTLDDFQRLATILTDYGLPVRIGFEATGNYHLPLAHHLGQAGFELKLVSSVGLARDFGKNGRSRSICTSLSQKCLLIMPPSFGILDHVATAASSRFMGTDPRRLAGSEFIPCCPERCPHQYDLFPILDRRSARSEA